MTDWWSYFLENRVAKQEKKKTTTSGEPGLKSEKKKRKQDPGIKKSKQIWQTARIITYLQSDQRDPQVNR